MSFRASLTPSGSQSRVLDRRSVRDTVRHPPLARKRTLPASSLLPSRATHLLVEPGPDDLKADHAAWRFLIADVRHTFGRMFSLRPL